MKKRAAALLLCILLMTGLATPTAVADDGVCFVAAGSNVLPVTDSTMPFWSGGYLYVSSTIFTGLAWEALGVGHIQPNAQQPLILYSGGDKSLIFTPGQSYARDLAGSYYYNRGAIQKNGNWFVPVSLVAEYFGLEYSLISNVAHGDLVWIRKPGFGLGAKDFGNAAAYSMEERYQEYLRGKQGVGPSGQEGPTGGNDPVEQRNAYLCILAGENTETLLDVLNQQDAQAAFFCTQAFLTEQGSLLRRMVSMGHTIGLLVDAEQDSMTVAEQLAAGNEALYRATCTKTRHALVENADEETLAAAEAAGYRCFVPELDRGAYGLRGGTDAENLAQRITARRADTTVWLADAVNGVGLRAFLTEAKRGIRLLALRETT